VFFYGKFGFKKNLSIFVAMKEIINNFWGKSNGETLVDHSKAVQQMSEYIFKNSIKRSCFKDGSDIGNIINVTALTHDIGKIYTPIQKRVKNQKGPKNIKITHSEIAWAFLTTYLNLNENEILKITNSIYYHHGCVFNPTDKGMTVGEVMSKLNEKEINHMKMFIGLTLGSEFLLDEPREEFKSVDLDLFKPPQYYSEIDEYYNYENTIIRTCLISADRIVSNFNGEFNLEKGKEVFWKGTNKENDYYIKESPYGGSERSEIQMSIPKKCNRNAVIQAPAGMGKTIIGMIWGSNEYSKKKMFWISPRNAVCMSNYNSIVDELNVTNNNHVSVELVLGGEILESKNKSNDDIFTADIIITNIDNLLAPTVKNAEAKNLYLLLSADIVFDEFHEFLCSSALFAGFLNLMNIRTKYTNSRSLKLSATPMRMDFLWGNNEHTSNTSILPNKETHYPAVHQKKYRVIVKELNDLNDLEINPHNEIVKFNAIKNAQFYHKKQFSGFNLIHSKYQISDLKNKMDGLMGSFGKNGNRKLKHPSLIATPLIQASLNISFSGATEMVMSPESFLQLIGRCERFNDYDHLNTIDVKLIKLLNNRNESKMKDIHYSNALSDKWFDYIKKHNGKYYTLDELYMLYNKFWNDYELDLKKYIKEMKKESLKNFKNIFPKRHTKEKNNEFFYAGGNVLRASDENEIFVIYKNNDGVGYSDPFSVKLYHNKTFAEQFNEDYGIERTLVNIFKELNEKDDRFDYAELLNSCKYMMKRNKSCIDVIRGAAKKSNTPYIDFTRRYDKFYGVIENGLL